MEHEQFETNWQDQVDNFDQMGLRDELLRGIYGYGFVTPSPIQQKAIMPIIQGKDTIAQAQSGTGKTGCFATAILQIVDTGSEASQALVIAPTRELSQQIAFIIEELGRYLKIKVHTCVGGTLIRDDLRTLSKGGSQIIVGTPGRVLDMLGKRAIRPDHMRLLVIDEADEMLSRGFKQQIQDIFKWLPGDIQMALFSATMPVEILKLTKHFLRSPAQILVKNEDLTLEGIKQFYVAIAKEEWKYDVLLDIYNSIEINQAIIYCNTKKRVMELADHMKAHDFVVSFVHGEMPQIQRELVLKEFRTGSSRVLLTTDLLARGIDIQQVGLVVNFELPSKKENYVHRIGRSGRYGKKGTAINFVTPKDARFLQEIQSHFNTQINELPQDLGNLA